MSTFEIQAQDDIQHRLQHGIALNFHLPRRRPRPRGRPHPRPYPHTRPHPCQHLTAPPSPLFLGRSTAELLKHLCTNEKKPECRQHANLEQRAAPRRDEGRRRASRGGALRPWSATGAPPCVTYMGLALSDAAARQTRPAMRTQLQAAACAPKEPG